MQVIYQTKAETEHKSLFAKPSNLLLETIAFKNHSKQATFYLPTKYISVEAGLVGKALNDLIQKKVGSKKGFKTFFCSSHLEAIYGTIKIIRHNGFKKRDRRKTILILDKNFLFQPFFNPLQCFSKEDQVIPNIVFVKNVEEAKKTLEDDADIIGFIFLSDNTISKEKQNSLISSCKEKHIYTAISEGNITNWHKVTQNITYSFFPDVVLFGENIVNSEIPFGAICIQNDTYKPWNSIEDCLTHSSTFTGNTLPLTFFLLLYYNFSFSQLEKFLSKYSNKFTSYFERYINPTIARLYRANRLNPKIQWSYQSEVCVDLPSAKKNIHIIDCVGGSGCSLRGHNPDNIQKIVNEFNSQLDYWARFADEIKKISSFPHCFPAISGSSSVDNAILLSIIAMAPKKVILTFKENYSGKSLIALHLSRYKEDYAPFTPLYPKVIEFDPFQNEAEIKIETIFNENEIGLVWFEALQGESLNEIPSSIIKFLNLNRRKYQFFIGIDEVLSGFFRTGTFLFSDQIELKPDVVSIGKGMSDMTFPVTATLISDDVYAKAYEKNPLLIKKLETFYLNQTGAYIALNALKSALNKNLASNAQSMEKYFKEKLSTFLRTPNLITGVKGKGLLLYLNLNKKNFAVKLLGPFTTEFLLTSALLNKMHLHLFNLRITPALTITKKEMDLIIQKLTSFIAHCKSFHILFYGFHFMLRSCLYIMISPFRKIKQKIKP